MYRIVLAAAIAAMSASTAHAALQSYNFTGMTSIGSALPVGAFKSFSGTLSYNDASSLTSSAGSSNFYAPDFLVVISFSTGQTATFYGGTGYMTVQSLPNQSPLFGLTTGGVFDGDATANLTFHFNAQIGEWSDLNLPSALALNELQSTFLSVTYGGLGIESPRQEVFGSLTSLEATAVPEPSEWAIMLFGLGLLGACLRARRHLAGIWPPFLRESTIRQRTGGCSAHIASPGQL